MKFVYELRDGENNVVYVGQTADPKRRLHSHTKSTSKSSGMGKFYGRTDITMDVVAGPISKREALDLEHELQIQHGLVTDRDKAGLGGKVGGGSNKIFTFEIAEEIRAFYATGRYSQRALAKLYNTSQTTIYGIIHRLNYVCP